MATTSTPAGIKLDLEHGEVHKISREMQQEVDEVLCLFAVKVIEPSMEMVVVVVVVVVSVVIGIRPANSIG